MFVLYFYDANTVINEPLKEITLKETLRTCETFHGELASSGFKPATHWLDNESLEALKHFVRQ